MSTFVLVHGAWHGGWCWKRVRGALQAHGHQVFTPTLTGVADRSHLLSREVNLETHITDVVNLILWEERSDVVLCGHSYGGAVISGVADRIADRIGALVYLDAFVLQNGQSLYDTLPAAQKDMQVEGVKQTGDGWKVPPIPAEVFNVNAKCPPYAIDEQLAETHGWRELHRRLPGGPRRVVPGNGRRCLGNGDGMRVAVSVFPGSAERRDECV